MDLAIAAAGSEDPLSQPTRARLFALLGELSRPVTTAELARRVGLHPNGVRAHLDRLEQARLVRRGRVEGARGRPADTWTVAPGAAPFGRAPSGYEDLGRWLARALVDGAPESGVVEALERTGEQVGRELAQPAEPASPPRELEGTLTALGFQPEVVARRPHGVLIRLCNCPYRAAARENRAAICGLHRGLSRGLIEALDPSASLDAFVPRDPDQAGCELSIGTGA